MRINSSAGHTYIEGVDRLIFLSPGSRVSTLDPSRGMIYRRAGRKALAYTFLTRRMGASVGFVQSNRELTTN